MNSKNSKLAVVLGALALFAVITVVVVIGQGGDDSSSTGTDTSTKPTVEVPDAPATELKTTDIVEGDGAEATAGSQISVNYVGVAQSTGKEFDSSWDREPFQFQLGSGQVIPGWDQGIEGMKVGGRRELVIPGDLAYGPQGQPPDIGPDETLVFVVDLLDVQPASPTGSGQVPGSGGQGG